MKLIITEKPSVAAAIAAVVGANEKKDGYHIGDNCIVTWCFGHLIRLAEPADYSEDLEQWRLDTLPIIPNEYRFVVMPKTAKQFKIIKSLMERKDVVELIEATDAGREGELIFRLVYQAAQCKKPYRRLWINSLEESSIKEGLSSAKPSAEYDPLFSAALCRMKADWLIGINLTRFYTLVCRQKLPCGRVQTPTINMIASRQEEISNFVPKHYFSIKANLGAFFAYTRTDERKRAIELLEKCAGAEAVVTKVTTEEKEEKAPALYDLTTLQRDANRLLGYSAQQTLDYAQALYEKKLITYPRTDSRYITAAQSESTAHLIDAMLKRFDDVLALKHQNANLAQIINDKKVSDHHAILPTVHVTEIKFDTIPRGELLILWLLIFRVFIATSAPYRYKAVSATIDIEGYPFSATGREIVDASYKSLEEELRSVIQCGNKDAEEEETEQEQGTLPPMSDGNSFSVREITMEERQTKPPKAYTEDTLLKDMERAGSQIADKELRAAICNGLGTPATRAGVIENIIQSGYIRREGKKLIATPLAYAFLAVVTDKLKEPRMTAEWEFRFDAIQRGEDSADAFMHDVNDFLIEFIQGAKLMNSDISFTEERPIVGRCPRCGKNVQSTVKAYVCESGKDACGFVVWKELMGKKISEAQIKKLLEKGKSDIIKGFTNKSGKSFDAYLKIVDGNIQFGFPNRR